MITAKSLVNIHYCTQLDFFEEKFYDLLSCNFQIYNTVLLTMSFYTLHEALTSSIVGWFAIRSSIGSHFARTLHHDLFISSGPTPFSSDSHSCPTLCDPMNCSAPGLPVCHQLPESTKTHVHWVGDAIQPSHPLSSPIPPALNLSQHQGLFRWVSSSHQVAKVLEFQLQHQSFQWTPRTDLL